ncbi:hypothetical protein A9F13_07g00649 [Clavispora lusitaniae]|uniref:Uncharacterized protein n=1 Tax=Clavispora lusitaniae TaxID=36911 RepID=A0AA91PZJ4_CLALS|nr:hypothetical protein A9F13_07g00649 [Clavispora lusitaniae]
MIARSPGQVRDILDQLSADGSHATRTISELAEIASSEGLSRDNFNSLIDLVFDHTLGATQRLNLIRSCLVPKQDFLLDPSLINRIVSAVGTPEIYYKNGKQHKSKRLPIASQQALLEWLICALHLFGTAVFRHLRRSLPLLFGLLSYEFSRPYLSVLIVVAVHETEPFVGSKHSPIRSWHVHLVADLADKFPFDSSLQMLLAFFRKHIPGLDYATLFKDRQLVRLEQNFDMLNYPNPDIRRLLEWKPDEDNLVSAQMKQVELHLKRVFARFEQQSAKKKKVGSEPDNFDALEWSSSSVSIATVDSLRSLVSNFENITMSSITSVLSVSSLPNEHLRCMFLALSLIDQESDNHRIKKLEYAIKYHVLSDKPQKSHLALSQLANFAHYGGLKSLSAPLLEYSRHIAQSPNEYVVSVQIQLLELLPPTRNIIDAFSSTITNLDAVQESVSKSKASLLARQFFIKLARCIFKWNVLYSTSDLCSEFPVMVVDILSQVFAFVQKRWMSFQLGAQFAFLDIFTALKSVDAEDIRTWQKASALIPPPVLMYQLLVSTNPYVLSESLGYLAFLKKVTFEDESALQLRNSYVVDAINFLWKEAAFNKEAETLNWGMMLDSGFIEKISAHNYFGYSDQIRLRTVGGLVQNPSLAYMCAELVWMLEDQQQDINIRHPGPLAEETVKQLHQDEEVTWLPLSYHDIRVTLLNNLDRRGFHGMCDLLFSSLKSLAGRRGR